MSPAPAYVLESRWEFVAWNRPQALLYPQIEQLDGLQPNLMWAIFGEPNARALIVDWEGHARRLMAEFRAGIATLHEDPIVDELVTLLTGGSPEFAAWWPHQDVAQFQTRLRHHRHARAGDLVFEHQQLTPSDGPVSRSCANCPCRTTTARGDRPR